MAKLDKSDFYFWISKLNEIEEWIKDAEELFNSEGTIIRTMPLTRTEIQIYMEEHPREITEDLALKLHDFDMFIYRNIDLAYTSFREFYWKRSEYNPPQSHWWWLDKYFEKKIDINPDDVRIKWEKITLQKNL
ncbi:hypothetical protein DRP44_07250 [candidate division TA06 bacterium]|uniref:Uncharacterized protein n=1 Tax=candidate division TA06 bacterium TaxID=2250710 RepID=A0A660S749_UNCT6|nr:MAG: hypothetical protein DRP44_07250 [candidate division TA06 bacterium]